MLKEIGEVIEVDRDKIKVKFNKEKMCSSCCHSFLCKRNDEIIVKNFEKLPLKKGDKIEIAIEGKRFVLANFLIFLIPIFIFLFTLFIFKNLGELKSFLFALIVMASYFLILRVIIKKRELFFNLKIIKVLE
jgi:positive regulator of sigma E activity